MPSSKSGKCDNNGAYMHTKDPHRTERRRTLSGVRPVSHRVHRRILLPHHQARPVHGANAPHSLQDPEGRGKELLTTQCYVKGEPQNEKDGIYKSIRDTKARESVPVDFAPIKESRIGEVAAKFDIVLGFTPEGMTELPEPRVAAPGSL